MMSTGPSLQDEAGAESGRVRLLLALRRGGLLPPGSEPDSQEAVDAVLEDLRARLDGPLEVGADPQHIALAVRLRSLDRPPPDPLARAADRLLAGGAYGGAEVVALLGGWQAAVDARAAGERLATALTDGERRLAMSLDGSGVDLGPSRRMEAIEAHWTVADEVRSLVEGAGAVALEQLERLARWLDDRGIAPDGAGLDDLPRLIAQVEAVCAAHESLGWHRALVELYEELSPLLNAADTATLGAEAEAIAHAIEASSGELPSTPLLDALGAIALEGRSAEPIPDVVLDSLTGRFVRLLEDGGGPFAASARTAAVEPAGGGTRRAEASAAAVGLTAPVDDAAVDDAAVDDAAVGDAAVDDAAVGDAAVGEAAGEALVGEAPVGEAAGGAPMSDAAAGEAAAGEAAAGEAPVSAAPVSAAPVSAAPVSDAVEVRPPVTEPTGRPDDDPPQRVPAPPVKQPLSARAVACARALIDGRASGEGVETLLAMLLAEGELELAWWLTVSDEALGPRAALVDFVQLGLRFDRRDRETETRLYARVLDLVPRASSLSAEWATLVVAACVRPALCAPNTTMTHTLVEAIGEGDLAPPVLDVARLVMEFGAAGRPLAVRAFSSRQTWEAEREALGERTTRYLEGAPRQATRYAPATHVWQAWTKRGGALARLVEAAREGKRSAAELRLDVEQWRGDFGTLMDRTDGSLRARYVASPIKGSARTELRRKVEEACELCEDWFTLWERRPHPVDPDGHFQAIVERFEGVASAIPEALSDWLARDAAPLAGAAARRMMVAVTRAFEPVDEKGRSPLVRRRVAAEMLGEVPPRVERDAVLRSIVKPLSVIEAFYALVDRGCLTRAATLIEYAPAFEHERLLESLDDERLVWRRRLTEEATRVGDRVESGFLRGVFDETDRAVLAAEVTALEARLRASTAPIAGEGTLEPVELVELVERLKADIEQQWRQAADGRRAAFGETWAAFIAEADERPVEVPTTVRDEVERALGLDDLSVANDLLARCRTGLQKGRIIPREILTGQQRQHPFESYVEGMPRATEDAAHWLGRRAAKQPGDVPKDASQAVEFWRVLARGSSLEPADLGAPLIGLLGWLGFNIVEGEDVEVMRREGTPHFFTHLRVRGQIDSPLPRFGSSARGGYEVVLSWNEVAPARLVRWLRMRGLAPVDDRPLLVLAFRRLDIAARRHLVELARRAAAEVVFPLVLDEILLAWLCRQPVESRVEVFFEVGLAGTAENPYIAGGSGPVPPEMFFGRERDLVQIVSQRGPCIVYGGRQLGKSALLRQAERLHHKPEGDLRVYYYSLEVRETDLWAVIRKLLLKDSVLGRAIGTKTKSSSVRDAIAEAMAGNPALRVVVLLDECDMLLRVDRERDFANIALLRDLMDETDRRFKVVLTGLHSVQRFQRVANHPLAQLGDPICIGPLPPIDAAALVTRPLEAMGCQLVSGMLLNRVLAYTSCHPSLLHLFCASLVASVVEGRRFDHGTMPPVPLDERLVASVYRNVELGRKMGMRFDWTLNLDPRYRAIGYVFAVLEHEGIFEGRERTGLTVGAALDYLHALGPPGFDAVDPEEMRGLLDEMVGLGVLLAQQDRYRLRGPNMLRLLGSRDEIEATLERIASETLAEPDDLNSMRRIYHADRGASFISPLNLNQESRLVERRRSLDLIVGSPALGLGEVPEALTRLFESLAAEGDEPKSSERLVELALDDEGDASAVVERLREIYANPPHVGLLVVALSPVGPDRVDDLWSVRRWLGRLTTTERFVRVVAPLRPAALLHLVESGRWSELADGAEVHRLRLWGGADLRHRYATSDTLPDVDEALFLARTGGWWTLLRRVLEGGGVPRAELSTAEAQGFIDSIGVLEHEAARRLTEILVELQDTLVDRSVLLELAADDMPEDLAHRLVQALEELHVVRVRFVDEPGGIRREQIAVDPMVADLWRRAS